MSLLQDLDFLLKFDLYEVGQLRFVIRKVKTFVLLLGSNHGSDPHLGSFLLRIQDAVHSLVDQIHPFVHSDNHTTVLFWEVVSEFHGLIESSKEEMHEWLRQSTSLVTDGDHTAALDVIACVLENLIEACEVWVILAEVEELRVILEEDMAFLKCLVHFAKWGNVEASLKDLLARAQVVAIDVAHLSFTLEFDSKHPDTSDEDEIKRALEIIKRMQTSDPLVYKTCTQVLRSFKSATQGMDGNQALIAIKGILHFVICKLWNKFQQYTSDVVSIYDQLGELYQGVRSLTTILINLQHLTNCCINIEEVIGEVACDAGVFILSLHQSNMEVDPRTLGKMIETIKTILAQVTNTHVSLGRPISVTNEVVGLAKDTELIKEQLISGSKHLRVVVVVGMAGLGKTTLAAEVYNDSSVSYHFHVRAWSTISQDLDKRRVLLQLLNQIDPKHKGYEMDEHDLAQMVRRVLKHRRYLIVLDDIWKIDAWNRLRESFPDDDVKSRIIFTSRHHDSVPRDMLISEKPYSLNPLNEEKSMELLQRKLFPGNGGWPLELQDLMQIVKYCKGLPLSIIVIAGLLNTIEPHDWNKILDDFNSGVVSRTEQCKNTLELSYKYLPDHLRSCLLYFVAFPEDEEVSSRKLLHLWMAEGFIPESETKNRADVAEECLNDLIRRSLLMVARTRSIDGGAKACRIHDLIHDFCLQKANDENFFHFLKGCDELSAFNEPPKLQRLSIHSKPNHFQEAKLFCPRARSLLFNCSQEAQMWEEEKELANISFVILIFRHLRVLDIEQIRIASVFPKEIEQLVQLVFLAIRGRFNHIPWSIGKLSNLETLIVDPVRANTILLPDSLWDLQKLKYLCIRAKNYGGRFSMQNLESSSILSELERFSGLFIPFGDSMERLMRKFPNVRQLKCILSPSQDDTENRDKVAVFHFLSKLESLHVRFYGSLSPAIRLEFSFPENLRKLTLSSFQFTKSNASTIGELQSLEVLKFLHMSFEEGTLEMKEGEFLKLKVLKFFQVELIRWTADDDDLCLQELVLHNCIGLEEMPSCLEKICNLESIHVIDPTETVLNQVRQIEEAQKESGNTGINIRITKS